MTDSISRVFPFLYSNRVLQINSGIEFGLGNLQWEMAGALFGGWFLVYLIVWRGLHQSGYIIWFTALFPYSVMLVLLVKALTLPGAVDGLAAYVHVSKQRSAVCWQTNLAPVISRAHANCGHAFTSASSRGICLSEKYRVFHQSFQLEISGWLVIPATGWYLDRCSYSNLLCL